MLAAFFLWLEIIKTVDGQKGWLYLLFIISWPGSTFMSYYAAEFKQYSMDLFIAAIFTYFLVRQNEDFQPMKVGLFKAAKYLLLPAALLFSYPAYFFAPLPAFNLALAFRRVKPARIYLAIYCSSLLAFALLSFLSDIRYTIVNRGLTDYWRDYFISTASFPQFLKTFWEGLRNIYVRWFWEDKPVTHFMTILMPFALFFTVCSGIKDCKTNKFQIRSLPSILCYLLCALFVAAITHVYPFTAARVTLYLAPLIFFSIIKGISNLFKILPLYSILLSIFILVISSTTILITIKLLRLYVL